MAHFFKKRYLVVRDGVLPEDGWRNEAHLVPEVGLAVFGQVGEEALSHSLESGKKIIKKLVTL